MRPGRPGRLVDPKRVKRAKNRLHQLTSRRWGASMERPIKETEHRTHQLRCRRVALALAPAATPASSANPETTSGRVWLKSALEPASPHRGGIRHIPRSAASARTTFMGSWWRHSGQALSHPPVPDFERRVATSCTSERYAPHTSQHSSASLPCSSSSWLIRLPLILTSEESFTRST